MLCKLTCFVFGREVGLERLMWQVPTRTAVNLSMWHIGVYWLEFHAKQSGTYTLILDTYIVDLVPKVWSQCHWYRPDTCLFKEKHCGVHSSFARLPLTWPLNTNSPWSEPNRSWVAGIWCRIAGRRKGLGWSFGRFHISGAARSCCHGHD